MALDSLRIKLVQLAEMIHFRLFGHGMSDGTRRFLGHLSWSFFGGIVSMGLIFVLNILAGRWLGPEEYGKYSLVIALSSIFIIPMTQGIDTASVYYIAKSRSLHKKYEHLSSALLVSAPFILGVSLLLFLLDNYVAVIFSTSSLVVDVAILLGILLSLRNIFDAFTKGLHLFKFQSKLRIIESLSVAFVFFLIWFVTKTDDFRDYVFAVVAGYSVSIIIAALYFGRHFVPTYTHAKRLFSYGMYVVVGAIAGVLLNSLDKILINRFVGQEQLGIYNAYFTASTLVASQVAALFINVFFPHLVSLPDKDLLLRKVNRLAKIAFVPSFFVTCLFVFGIISLFGSEYPLDGLLVVEFSFLSVVVGYFTILWWLIASKSREGIRFTSIQGVVAGLLFALLMFLFRKSMSLHISVALLAIAFLYAAIIGNFKYARIK